MCVCGVGGRGGVVGVCVCVGADMSKSVCISLNACVS